MTTSCFVKSLNLTDHITVKAMAQRGMNNILLIHNGGEGGVRGTEICVIQSIKALHAAGYRITFARTLPVIDDLIRKNVIEIVDLRIPELLINGRRTKLPIAAYAKSSHTLVRLIKKLHPRLIYLSGGLPCQLAVPLGRIFDIPSLCHFHHPANRRYYYCWLVPFADKHIFPSKYTQMDARTKANVAGDVVYNGIDTSRFYPIERDDRWRTNLSIAPDAIVIGQVGQLTETKRPLFLLEAFAEAVRQRPNLHLCLVGRGRLEEALRNEVLQRGLLPKVTITGYVEETLPYYQHVFDVNALVSSEEGLGISILEGSACALPALISDCTGLSETTIPNVTGVSFAPADNATLIELMIHLADDGNFRRSAGVAGRKLVEAKFSLESYEEGVIAAVQQAIAGVNR